MAAADKTTWIEFLRNTPDKLRLKFVQFATDYFLEELDINIGLYSYDRYHLILSSRIRRRRWKSQDFELMVAAFKQFLTDEEGVVWPEKDQRPPSKYKCLDPDHLRRVFTCRHDHHELQDATNLVSGAPTQHASHTQSTCHVCDPKGFKLKILDEMYARTVRKIATALHADADLYKDVQRAVENLKLSARKTLAVRPTPRPQPPADDQ